MVPLSTLRSRLLRCSLSARRAQSTLPWFVDADEMQPAPQLDVTQIHPVPEEAPAYLKLLHSQLYQSPHLEKASVIVSRPPAMPSAPRLPLKLPQGRRNRAGNYSGELEGFDDLTNGLWDWVVMAQVKEGTEGRGTIESVIRTARQTLAEQSLPLPPNSKKRMHNGWAMIDAGSFAVHVLSKEAREKYFSGLIAGW